MVGINKGGAAPTSWNAAHSSKAARSRISSPRAETDTSTASRTDARKSRLESPGVAVPFKLLLALVVSHDRIDANRLASLVVLFRLLIAAVCGGFIVRRQISRCGEFAYATVYMSSWTARDSRSWVKGSGPLRNTEDGASGAGRAPSRRRSVRPRYCHALTAATVDDALTGVGLIEGITRAVASLTADVAS